MKQIGLSAAEDAGPEVDSGLLTGWLNRTDLARELTLSVETLQRWETRRMGPPCVRVGRKVLYRMEAVRDWLREQEARKAGVSAAPSPVGVKGAIMARTSSPIDVTTITALATEDQRNKDVRRKAYWSRLLADTMRLADAGKRIALMALIVKRLTATAAL